MGWTHEPDDGTDLYNHEGYAVALLADGSEPEPVQVRLNSGEDTTGNSSWWLYDGKEGRPSASAVRAGCSCGWRSTLFFPIDFTDHESTEGFEFNDGPFRVWQTEHIGALLGATMPSELSDALRVVAHFVAQLADDRPLVALTAIGQMERLIGDQAPKAGVAARQQHVTWDAIGKAIGATRQAASQRFGRHIPRD